MSEGTRTDAGLKKNKKRLCDWIIQTWSDHDTSCETADKVVEWVSSPIRYWD